MVKVIIYDHRCSYCLLFMRLVRRFDKRSQFAFFPFESEKAKALLRAQFRSSASFTMYVVTPRTIYWDKAAARYLIRSLGFPKPLALLAQKLYPVVQKNVSRLSKRKRIVRMPVSSGYSLPLKPAAKKLLAAFAE